MRDLSLTQEATTPWITVPFVGDELIGPGPRPSASTRAWDTNASEHRLQLRTIMPLPGRDDDREWSPFPVAGQVKLGGQSSPAASKPFIDRVVDPLFMSAWLGRRRAPLACWWARAVELSTLTSQMTSPTASERVWA